jgi:hypothetical protein
MLLRLRANSKLTRARQLLGIDRAVFYTLFSRGWQLVAGFGTILLIARFLSPIQQGFYYTFASLLSLQVFFELGLTLVVLQFASHESAHLNWTLLGTLEGDSTAKARLGSLMRLTLKWYAIAAGLLVLGLVPAGLLFFGSSPDAASAGVWQVPWAWLVLTTAGTLLLSPIVAVLEGCGLVAEVARFRLSQDLLAFPVFWLSLLMGAGLFASPLLQTTRLITTVWWLLTRQRPFLGDQSVTWGHCPLVARDLADAMENRPELDGRLLHFSAVQPSLVCLFRRGSCRADGNVVDVDWGGEYARNGMDLYQGTHLWTTNCTTGFPVAGSFVFPHATSGVSGRSGRWGRLVGSRGDIERVAVAT